MSRSATGKAVVIMSIGTLIATPIGGYLADNVVKKRRLMSTLPIICSALCWLFLVIFVDKVNMPILSTVLFVMAFTADLGVGAQLAQVKEVYPPEETGAAMGMNNQFLILGGAVFSTVFGFIIGSEMLNPAKQFSNGFLFYFVCLVCAAISSLISVETFERQHTETYSATKVGVEG